MKLSDDATGKDRVKPQVTVLDYGMGNIYSVVKALELFGAQVTLSADKEVIMNSQALVLPGDGAFGAAMERLKEREILGPLLRHIENGKWLFGICVGFQLLFEESDEFGIHKGLGIFPGRVRRFQGNFTIPHMGWNDIEILNGSHQLLKGLGNRANFYFIHSYYAMCADDSLVLGRCHYHDDFTAIVGRGKIFGTQFHPEKSHEDGLLVIKNFCDLLRMESSEHAVYSGH
jgi:glutamine amidotransferase